MEGDFSPLCDVVPLDHLHHAIGGLGGHIAPLSDPLLKAIGASQVAVQIKHHNGVKPLALPVRLGKASKDLPGFRRRIRDEKAEANKGRTVVSGKGSLLYLPEDPLGNAQDGSASGGVEEEMAGMLWTGVDFKVGGKFHEGDKGEVALPPCSRDLKGSGRLLRWC